MAQHLRCVLHATSTGVRCEDKATYELFIGTILNTTHLSSGPSSLCSYVSILLNTIKKGVIMEHLYGCPTGQEPQAPLGASESGITCKTTIQAITLGSEEMRGMLSRSA